METAFRINDTDNVLRRVPVHPSYIKPDGTFSSYVFRLRSGERGISVDVERLSSFQKATLGRSDFKLLSVNVGTIRNQINDGLDVVYDPLPENDAHALITGVTGKTKQKALVKHSTEVLE